MSVHGLGASRASAARKRSHDLFRKALDEFGLARVDEGQVADAGGFPPFGKPVVDFGQAAGQVHRATRDIDLAHAVIGRDAAAGGRRIVADVQLRDEGVEFDPFLSKEPDINGALDERQIGGLGIHLIRNLMDDHFYRRDGKKNVTTLMKRIEA